MHRTQKAIAIEKKWIIKNHQKKKYHEDNEKTSQIGRENPQYVHPTKDSCAEDTRSILYLLTKNEEKDKRF